MAKIYQIKNTINNKVYVGKTHDTVENRWKIHIRDSRKPSCKNRPLYRAINKYGVTAFEVTELETCPSEDACTRECYWIEKTGSFKYGYNATTGGDGKPYVDKTNLYSLWSTGHTIKEIHVITGHDVKLISRYLQEQGISPSDIKQRARSKHTNLTPVVKYTDNNNFIEQFPSAREAARTIFPLRSTKSIDSVTSHIHQVCRHLRSHAYGFKWRYAEYNTDS